MIEKLDGFPDNVVAIAAHGRVTKADYAATIVPAVEKALTAHERVRVFYELGPGFAGLDGGAMVEDFMVGMRHIRHWERIAVVTDVAWIAHAVSLFGFLMPGAVRVFPTTDAARARAWLLAEAA